MNVVVDENVPRRTVVVLTELGHRVSDVRGTDAQSACDSDLWAMACSQRALLITTDKGFSRYWVDDHHGILIVRLRQPNRERIHSRVMMAIAEIAESDWPGLLVIMRDQARSTRRRPSQGEF